MESKIVQDGKRNPGVLSRLAAALCAAAVLAVALPARAADPPKWVAALYVAAQTSVGLRWMAVPGATAYKVLRSETAGSGYAEIASTPQPQYFDAKVEPGSVYYYVLQSVAGTEVSANSEQREVRIPGEKKKVVVAPTWAGASVQPSTEFGKTTYRVGLSWSKVPDAIAYNVYKSTTSGKDFAMLSSTSETSVVDAAVEAGKTYYYTLSALDGSFQETPQSPEKVVVVEEVKKKEVAKKRVKLEVKGRAAKVAWTAKRGDQSGNFDFFEPFDIEYDAANNTLVASSNANQRVFVLNANDGEVVRVIGGPGKDPGLFLSPMGIGIDADSRVYVSDNKKNTVQIFTAEGTFVKEFPVVAPAQERAKDEPEPKPLDVEVHPKSGEVFVADRSLSKIWVFDEGGKYQRRIGETGGGPEQMLVPMYLAIDPEGNIVVIAANNTRVLTLTPEGKVVRAFGENKAGVGAFIIISGITYDKEGNPLVADKSSAMLQAFAPDGRYLYNVANETNTGGLPLFAPKGMATDRQKNRVFVTEGLQNRITAIDLVGPVPPAQEEAPAAQ